MKINEKKFLQYDAILEIKRPKERKKEKKNNEKETRKKLFASVWLLNDFMPLGLHK